MLTLLRRLGFWGKIAVLIVSSAAMSTILFPNLADKGWDFIRAVSAAFGQETPAFSQLAGYAGQTVAVIGALLWLYNGYLTRSNRLISTEYQTQTGVNQIKADLKRTKKELEKEQKARKTDAEMIGSLTKENTDLKVKNAKLDTHKVYWDEARKKYEGALTDQAKWEVVRHVFDLRNAPPQMSAIMEAEVAMDPDGWHSRPKALENAG